MSKIIFLDCESSIFYRCSFLMTHISKQFHVIAIELNVFVLFFLIFVSRRSTSPPSDPGPASSRLSHLHWLLVCRRMQYKIALLTYKSLLTKFHHTSEIFYIFTNHRAVSALPVGIFYVFLPALLISVDIPSVFLLLPFGTNYPPLSGSPTNWTHLNVG